VIIAIYILVVASIPSFFLGSSILHYQNSYPFKLLVSLLDNFVLFLEFFILSLQFLKGLLFNGLKGRAHLVHAIGISLIVASRKLSEIGIGLHD